MNKYFQKPETVRGKFYRIDEANEIFAQLNAACENYENQIAALKKQNERLIEENETLNKTKNEISDTLMSAKQIAAEILEEAGKKANRKIVEAEKKAQQILNVARQESNIKMLEAEERAEQLAQEEAKEHAIRRAAESFIKIREEQEKLVESINEEWKRLLIDFYGEFSDSEIEQLNELNIPYDLSDKVNEIANQLKMIEFDDDE